MGGAVSQPTRPGLHHGQAEQAWLSEGRLDEAGHHSVDQSRIHRAAGFRRCLPTRPAAAAQARGAAVTGRPSASTAKSSLPDGGRPSASTDKSSLPDGGAAPPPVPASVAQFGLTLGVVRCRGRRHHCVAQPKLSLWEEGSIASTGGLVTIVQKEALTAVAAGSPVFTVQLSCTTTYYY